LTAVGKAQQLTKKKYYVGAHLFSRTGPGVRLPLRLFIDAWESNCLADQHWSFWVWRCSDTARASQTTTRVL